MRMKTVLLVLSVVFFSQASFAQDMSNQETYEQAYRQMPDGSSVYVGKCKTHESRPGKTYKVSGLILESVSTVGMKFEKAKKIVDQVGVVPFRMMMKEYFGTLADLSSDHKMIQEFIDYADDLEIDVISLIAKGNREFIRFNVGYGGGNGGYLVIQKNGDSYQKISKTEDGDLVYCDASVWN
jgi:hypothetical protein